MKTIKAIDLLNKIANGENVPKKIRYLYEDMEGDTEIIYEYVEEDKDYRYYYDRTWSNLITEDLFEGYGTEALNQQFEIIEE